MFTLRLSIGFVSSVGHRSWNFRTLGVLRGAKGIKQKEKILNSSKTCYVVFALCVNKGQSDQKTYKVSLFIVSSKRSFQI